MFISLTISAVVTFINCHSVRLATMVQNVFFFGKLFAIGVIICVGFYTLVNGIKLFCSNCDLLRSHICPGRGGGVARLPPPATPLTYRKKRLFVYLSVEIPLGNR